MCRYGLVVGCAWCGDGNLNCWCDGNIETIRSKYQIMRRPLHCTVGDEGLSSESISAHFQWLPANVLLAAQLDLGFWLNSTTF